LHFQFSGEFEILIIKALLKLNFEGKIIFRSFASLEKCRQIGFSSIKNTFVLLSVLKFGMIIDLLQIDY